MNRRNHDSNATNKTLSRGGFVRTLTLGAVGTAILAATSKARAADKADSPLEYAVPVVDMLRSPADLPGATDIMQFVNSAYPTDLTADEALMLRGALYLKADRLMQALADDVTLEAATNLLSKPLNANPLSPLVFSGILAETGERAANDPQFAESVTQAGALFDHLATQIGQSEDPIRCRILLVGVVCTLLCIVVVWP